MLDRWRKIAEVVGKTCTLGRQLADLKSDAEAQDLLEDTFYGKSTNTLARRASSFSLLLRWRHRHMHEFDLSWPLSEAAVYEYVKSMCREGAPATRAKGFVEALYFASGTLGLPVLAEVKASARIGGVVMKSYERKRLTKKAPPLTVPMVEFLEELVMTEESPLEADRVGFALFVLFSRSRCRDASGIMDEPMLDVAEDQFPPVGYVEAKAAAIKTSRGVKRRRLGIPVVAPAFGLRVHEGKGWGDAWIAARKDAHVHAGPYQFLAPAVAPGGIATLADTPMSAPQLTCILRKTLAQRFPAREVEAVSSHSLKATVLSWLA
ncbi:MAG: hypothetical protein GY772_22085, partial [bacterium]|nr:hypothetical protein [bacterium]